MENKQSTLLELYHHQNQCNDADYLMSTISYHVAPVLHSDKPAVLLTFASNHRNLRLLWEMHKKDFPYGARLKFYETKQTDSHVCVLFYDESALTEVLMAEPVQAFLHTEGYDRTDRLTDILATLRQHSQDCCPHEVGIFLGYPLEDVVGFIQNNGKNCLVCGYWKVYQDPERKQAQFNAYDNSRMQVIDALVNERMTPKQLLT